MQALQLGPVCLTLLLDARGRIEGNRVFHPATQKEWSPGLTVDDAGNVPINITALLITCDSGHILVDTGYGREEQHGREESVLRSLAAVGVDPDDIRQVILTHAHGDHCMGNTVRRDGQWLPVYRNAEYLVQEFEIASMRESNEAVWRSRFQPLVDAGQLRTLDGDTTINEWVTCRLTPGHTIGHQSVVIQAGGDTAVYLGDLAIMAGNLERPEWGPNWAWSREVDEDSRRRMNAWAAECGATLIIGHDPERTWVRMERDGEGYRAVTLDI
jgi:glyoxylase-like metal-dependent hydrolase (beta-lactamase superfamily II)